MSLRAHGAAFMIWVRITPFSSAFFFFFFPLLFFYFFSFLSFQNSKYLLVEHDRSPCTRTHITDDYDWKDNIRCTLYPLISKQEEQEGRMREGKKILDNVNHVSFTFIET